MLEMLGFTGIMFMAHWLFTVPAALFAFFLGHNKNSGKADVWLLLGVGVALFFLMPYAPGAAHGPDGLVYMALPLVVPIYILVPYFAGILTQFLFSGGRIELRSPIKINDSKE